MDSELTLITSRSVDECAAASLTHFIQNGPSSPWNNTAHPVQRPIMRSPECSKVALQSEDAAL